MDVGIKYITDMLNQALTKEQTTTVLLETMAGKGTEVGRSFEELKAIIDGVEIDEKLGVCGSHKDRHAKIGEGQIGLDAIVRIINHDALKNLPFLLETPNELDGYAKEIELLKSKYIW